MKNYLDNPNWNPNTDKILYAKLKAKLFNTNKQK